jgi:MoaA/NifB/PqqE/SkfB family radical SAM enzyme
MGAARLYHNVRYAFCRRKPRLVVRLAWNLALVALRKAPRLRYVDVALDFTCNQHCQHCFARTYDRQRTRGRNLISAGQYRRLVDQAIALGAVSFSIQGGEPFAMFEKTKQVLRAFRPDRTLVSIKSNGTLITPERAREARALGVDIVTISVDSGVPEEHDAFRGQRGAYGRAMRGVRHCREAGLKVIVACTVSHANARSVGVMRLIDETRALGVLCFLIKAAPSGNWAGNRSVLLTEEDSRWIDEVTRRYPHCRTDFEANYLAYGCGAMKEIIYVSQYGDVMSCPFIQVSVGNVLEEPLEAIWRRGLSVPEFSRYAARCLIAEDPDFIDRYIAVTQHRDDLPVSIAEFERTKTT